MTRIRSRIGSSGGIIQLVDSRVYPPVGNRSILGMRVVLFTPLLHHLLPTEEEEIDSKREQDVSN